MAIRGPIGGLRRDFYTAYVAMHAGKPYPREQYPHGVSLTDFMMPWVKRDPEEDEDES